MITNRPLNGFQSCLDAGKSPGCSEIPAVSLLSDGEIHRLLVTISVDIVMTPQITKETYTVVVLEDVDETFGESD